MLPISPTSLLSRLLGPNVTFAYRSQDSSISQNTEFLTLCFAMLIFHGGAGLPALVIAANLPRSERPDWTDRITHLNPISVLWRYYAVADRRIRALHWDSLDSAATNSVFWDNERKCWDGSETVMVKSRAWVTEALDDDQGPPAPGSSLKRMGLALQGVYAAIWILPALTSSVPWSFPKELPHNFVPLGILGLAMVQASWWLGSDTSVYAYRPSSPNGEEEARELAVLVSQRLHSARSWKGIAFRVWWAYSGLAISGISIMASSKLWWDMTLPDTLPQSVLLRQMLFSLAYLIGSAGGLVIHLTYHYKHCTDTTVIPCIQARWYKIFTMVLICLVLASVAAGTLELVRLPNEMTS